METTHPEIPETVPELASQNKRLLNFIIDTLVLTFLLIALLAIAQHQAIPVTEDQMIYLSLFTSLLYFFLMEYFLGQTVGKILTKTMVVDEYGDSRTLKIVFLRTLCRQIPFEFVSFIPNGMGFHDVLSRSRVINL